jgi:uncharacterized protein
MPHHGFGAMVDRAEVPCKTARQTRSLAQAISVPRSTGIAELPLHSGRVPGWLASRMAALGRVIAEAIVHCYGADELLRRLAHPFWFQSFGALMGMDWHSSGITTSVVAALKRGLGPLQNELGVYVCGGRGRHSRQTPAELTCVAESTGLDPAPLIRASRLVAKVDSAAIQDGYDLYLHAFICSAAGNWCVVQQGMNVARREARRYHWLSESVGSFIDSPHAAIEGKSSGGLIVNLADMRALSNRQAGLKLVAGGPARTVNLLRRIREAHRPALSLFPECEMEPAALVPHLRMPAHHDVRSSDVELKRLHAVLAAAADRGPRDFTELLLTPGVGRRTMASLALAAEVIYGAPARFSDPARFSLAHGGKDAHPFPVPLKVYDQTIRVLTAAVSQAKLGKDDKLFALQRLDQQARVLEGLVSGPTFDDYIVRERAESKQFGGRSVCSPSIPAATNDATVPAWMR